MQHCMVNFPGNISIKSYFDEVFEEMNLIYLRQMLDSMQNTCLISQLTKRHGFDTIIWNWFTINVK